jgi:hypothetical protein
VSRLRRLFEAVVDGLGALVSANDGRVYAVSLCELRGDPKRMECDRGGSTEHCARLRLALIDVAGDRDSPGMTENCFGFAAVGSRWCRAESRSSDLENGQSGHRAIRSSASGRAERRVCTSAQSPRVVSTISRCALRTEADGRSALLGLRTRLLTDLRQFFLF